MSGLEAHVPKLLPPTQTETLCFQDISSAEPLSAFWNFYPSAYTDVVPIYPTRGMTLKQAIRHHYSGLKGKRRIMYGFLTPEEHCTICLTYPKMSPTPQPLYTWIDNPEPVKVPISGVTLTQQKHILQRLSMKEEVVKIKFSSIEFPSNVVELDSDFLKSNFPWYRPYQWQDGKGEAAQNKDLVKRLQDYLFPSHSKTSNNTQQLKPH